MTVSNEKWRYSLIEPNLCLQKPSMQKLDWHKLHPLNLWFTCTNNVSCLISYFVYLVGFLAITWFVYICIEGLCVRLEGSWYMKRSDLIVQPMLTFTIKNISMCFIYKNKCGVFAKSNTYIRKGRWIASWKNKGISISWEFLRFTFFISFQNRIKKSTSHEKKHLTYILSEPYCFNFRRYN